MSILNALELAWVGSEMEGRSVLIAASGVDTLVVKGIVIGNILIGTVMHILHISAHLNKNVPSDKDYKIDIFYPCQSDDTVEAGGNDSTLHTEGHAKEARCVYTSPSVFEESGVRTPILRVESQLPALMKG